ncbi:GspH/FimT family protein [Pseudoxanthomonas putridarboris]
MARTPSPPRDRRRLEFTVRPTGVTLIELCVAMAVAAILAAIAVPSYKAQMKRQRVDTVMHLLTSHLASARVTAITHNVPVIVCPSHGDGRCRQDSDWSANWLMFRDPDGDRQPDQDIDIYRNEQAPRDPRLRILSTHGRPYVRYQPNGLSYGSNLTIRVCYDGETAGSIVINNTGRARSVRSQAATACGN